MAATRAARHIGSSASGDYLLALHARGAARAAQHGRDVTLRPGDMALFDSARPYSIAFTGAGTEPAVGAGRFGHLIYQIPRTALDARSRTIATATAVRVPANGGAGQLASRYVTPSEFRQAGLLSVPGSFHSFAGRTSLPSPHDAVRASGAQDDHDERCDRRSSRGHEVTTAHGDGTRV
jgi:hypothetical protein